VARAHLPVRATVAEVGNLAARHPEKLEELPALFLAEASKAFALSIDDRSIERVNAALAGRPELMDGRTSLTLAEGMVGMTEYVFLNIKNQSMTNTAEIEVPEGTTAYGTLIAQGGCFVGGSLYVNDGVGRIGRTQPMIYSADETADVGIDLVMPVVAAIGSGNKSKVPGHIPKAQVEVP
jgi:arylsulfatase